MSLDRQGLVLFHNYCQGNAYDFSGNGNDGTLVNSEGFIKTESGWGYKPQSSNGHILVNDNPSLQISGSATFIYKLDVSKQIDSGVYISKRDAGGTNYYIYFNAKNVPAIYDGLNYRTWTLTDAVSDNAKVITVVTKADNSTASLYVDGRYHSESSGTVTITADDAPLYIGNVYSGSVKADTPISAVMIYNVEKTPEEISAIHKSIVTLRTPKIGHRNFYTGPSADPNDTNADASWNMQIDKGEVKDVIGDSHGTPTAGIDQIRTPWGETALVFDGNGSRIDCGNSASLNYTTQTFGGKMWVRVDSLAPIAQILMSNAGGSDGYELVTTGSGKVYFATRQAGASQVVTSTAALTVGMWCLVGFCSVAGDKNYIYIDAVEDGSIDRIDPVASTQKYYIGAIPATAFPFGGGIAAHTIGTYASKEEFEAKQLDEYRRVANKVIYSQDMPSSAVQQSYVGSGTLNGTDVRYEGGTGLRVQPIDGTSEKLIQGAIFGSIGSITHTHYPLGTYTWDMVTTATQRCYFLPMSDGTSATSGNRLSIDSTVGAVGRVEMLANFSPLMTSADGYTTPGQKYRFKLVLKNPDLYTNNCFLYMDDVLIPAATGSNPSRYVPVAGSIERMLIGPYGLGKVGNIKQYFGDITR